MAKKPTNSGKHWTEAEVNKLQQLADGNMPTRLIAHELGRSVATVYNKATEKNLI